MFEVKDERFRQALQELEVLMYSLGEKDEFSTELSIHVYGDEVNDYSIIYFLYYILKI